MEGQKGKRSFVRGKREDSSRSKSGTEFDHRDGRYQCKVCGETYSRKNDLSKHMQTHSEEKNKHCRFWGKIFTTALNLTKHMLRHTGEITYKCSECNKMFAK